MEFFRVYRASTARPLKKGGFTLIELLVVLAIIAIITGIALSSQGTFNKTLVLANTAYDVGLTLRSAQTYGISTRAIGSVANAGYGVDFNRGTPGTFIFFADSTPPPSSSIYACHSIADTSRPDARPGNCVYDSGEKVTTYTLGNRITVADFCAFSGGSWSCANSGNKLLSSLDIVFARPNPDAFMSTNGSYSTTFPVSAACITLTSPQGGARYVSIAVSGEINVRATSCP